MEVSELDFRVVLTNTPDDRQLDVRLLGDPLGRMRIQGSVALKDLQENFTPCGDHEFLDSRV